MPKTGPFLAIWSDRDDSKVFCYLESECDTLKTAGSSRRDLYSHLDPILFTAHSTQKGYGPSDLIVTETGKTSAPPDGERLRVVRVND